MQEQTPVPKRKRKMTRKATASKAKKTPPRAYKQLGNNPYAQVPVKTNNMVARKSANVTPTSGFGFPGSIY